MQASQSDVPEMLQRLPLWHGQTRFAALSGGVSNASFKVTDDRGSYVARIGKNYPFHQVDRQREAIAARAAFNCGLSPETLFSTEGVMVMRFVEAKTLDESDVRQNWRDCLSLVKRCHQEMPAKITGQGAIFWVFQILRDYAQTIISQKHSYSAHVPFWMEINENLEKAQKPLPIIFGHHDLLPGNFLNDGKRLWLIDWEYAAFGTAMFDLANLAANNSFTAETEAEMLEVYFGPDLDAQLWRAYDAMKVASALRETMWGIVSEIYLNAPGVNYHEYTATQLSRFEQLFKIYKMKYGGS